MGILNIIFSSLVLVVKTPGVLIAFFYHRHAGVQAFEQELHRSGIPPTEVAILTDVYKRMLFPGWRQLLHSAKTIRLQSSGKS